MDLFGFEFTLKKKDQEEDLKSIARDENDGSLVVTKNEHQVDVIGDSWGWSVTMDIDPLVLSETALINRYREMSLVPEVDKAIDIIINEMISTEAKKVVSIDLDDIDYSESLKQKITEEFDHIIKLLDFNNQAYEVLRRWYIDGRLQYQVVIDQAKFKEQGIGKLTYLDPRKLKKVKVVASDKDPRTGAITYQNDKSYYIYSESGFLNNQNLSTGMSTVSPSIGMVSIADEAVVQVTSGLLDPSGTVVLSYLHKAIRPLNQLKSLEDATMIYKLARAPERRIFYIDVGNLPPAKAEQVLQKQMNQYRSKMVYDVGTGSVRSDPKQMTMIEDYWLPRRSDGRATEITTLQGGTQLGQMDELNYFLNKVYNSLNVPITRMDPSTGFSFGRSTEITRDEVIFTKFVARLRRRFSGIFLDLLKRQLALKNILNDQEFERIKQDIAFVFESDNHFNEMLETEIFETRLNILDRVVNYMAGGQFMPMFSKEWAYKNVLKMTDEEIDEMLIQIEEDKENLKEEQAEMGDQLGDDDDGNGFKGAVPIQHQADVGGAMAKQAIKSNKPNSINNTTDTTTNTTTQGTDQ